ncbi:MAG TPA: ABC transporter substrate-binding protein, partial [Stellaceae bacterium]
MTRAALAIVAGTVIAAALAAPAFAEDVVRVGNPAGDDFHFSFANVGSEAGIFKQNGLTLEITALAGGAKLHTAMTAGSLDIALGAGTDFGLIVKGAPEKGVGALATKPSNIVIQGNTKNGITTIQALKGKKVAVSSVGALTYWMAQKLSQHEGWGLDGMELVATGGGQANVAGFETGSLDAAVTSLEAALRVE